MLIGAQNLKKNKFSENEQHPFEEWKKQMNETIAKLRRENVAKDQRIAEYVNM